MSGVLVWTIVAGVLLVGGVAVRRAWRRRITLGNVTIGFGRTTQAERDPLADQRLEAERDRVAPIDSRD